jgi:ferrochelatase
MNIGTPRSSSPKDVGLYLKEFLMDKYILKMPWLFRWLLVHLIIVPRRKFKSALSYQKIWTEKGSPLLLDSLKLMDGVNRNLHENSRAFLGMRYGQPSIASQIDLIKAQGFENLVLVPLYPQYAEATTLSSIEIAQKYLTSMSIQFQSVSVVPPFYKESFFVEPWLSRVVELSDRKLVPEDAVIDHVLLSYHGLPESHIYKDVSCSKDGNCCLAESAEKKSCYRSHCVQTTAALKTGIAKKLNLRENQISMSFQSRVGPAKWLEPSTQSAVKKLAQMGVRNLLVICPSFVTDCLETLEEIAIEEKKSFLEHGGKTFQVLPCLNAHPQWTLRLAQHLTSRLCQDFIKTKS